MSTEKRDRGPHTLRTLLLLLAGLILWLPAPRQGEAGQATVKKRFVIGGLFSLTGAWSTLGTSSAVALELAAEDLNAYFDRIDSQLEIAVAIEDTQLDPQLALQRLRSLSARGVRVVVGPQSSAEVAAIKAFADANDVLLISQSSTAGSLAIARDNVLRLCPGDDLEGEAVAALMWADGIRVIVPVWRDDPGNGGLHDAVQAHFVTALGGTMLPGVKYAPDTADFSTAAAALASQVSAARAQHGNNAVAVYLAAFDEVVALFQAADASSVLRSTRWYGSDGVALSNALLGDGTAAAFAALTGYPNPTFGLDAGAQLKWAPVAARIESVTEFAPDAFALGVYDAAWLAAQTVALGKNKVELGFVKDELPGVAGSFFGTTGWTILNEAGDRRFGNFDFWAIRDVEGEPQWVAVAHYNTASGVLVKHD